MTDYTPTTEQIKYAYVQFTRNAFVASTGELEAEFDRWFEEVTKNAG